MKVALQVILFLTLATTTFAGVNNMKHTLKDKITLDPENKTVHVLSEGSFKVIGLGFKKGQILEKHKTTTPAFLIVQSGEVSFKIDGQTYDLRAGDYYEIPAKVEHEVIGKEDSFLYLIK